MENQPGSDTALVGAFCDAATDVARQQAFSVLLERHGAMVLGTCRRVIGNHSDAEDAAQAVFITLTAKARQLRDHPTIGGWLHRSARHIAMRQRDAARTRSRYEGHQEAQAMTAPSDNLDDSLRTDMREELDHALDLLAERYRVPLVLHYLDGHSQEDVARILQVKEGTLASLLSRGRELLRQQLQRKGVAVGALSLASLLASEGAAHAALPSSFIIATAKSASAIAAGSFSTAAAVGTAAPHVLALATGGGSTITALGTLKLAAASIVAASVLSLGAVTAVSLGAENSSDKIVSPAPITSSEIIPGEQKTEANTTNPQQSAAPAIPQPLTAATAEAAVQTAIRALRFNDMAAFLRRLDPEGQQRAEAAWDNVGQFVSNPWVGGMFSRMLRVSNEPNSGDLIATYVTPMLMMIETNSMAQQLTHPETAAKNNYRGGLAQMAINGTLNNVINGTLASGLESEQTLAIQKYLGSVAAWLPTAGFTDPDKAKRACTAISEALKKFGTTNLSDLTKLELNQFLERVSLALPDLKRAFAVYDLHIDRALDSVAITSTTTTDATVVRMTFTAFDTTHTFPLKMVEHQKVWTVTADSPLTHWIQLRGNNQDMGNGAMRIMAMDMMNNRRGGGNNGGNGGGNNGGGRGNQPAEVAPAPTADPGF